MVGFHSVSLVLSGERQLVVLFTMQMGAKPFGQLANRTVRTVTLEGHKGTAGLSWGHRGTAEVPPQGAGGVNVPSFRSNLADRLKCRLKGSRGYASHLSLA